MQLCFDHPLKELLAHIKTQVGYYTSKLHVQCQCTSSWMCFFCADGKTGFLLKLLPCALSGIFGQRQMSWPKGLQPKHASRRDTAFKEMWCCGLPGKNVASKCAWGLFHFIIFETCLSEAFQYMHTFHYENKLSCLSPTFLLGGKKKQKIPNRIN